MQELALASRTEMRQLWHVSVIVVLYRRLRARLFYLQYSVCGEKRLLSFQTNQLPFWSTKSESTL